MQNQIIDGKATAASIRNELKKNVSSATGVRQPGLAVILVGDDPASHFYVQRKQDACKEVGIQSYKSILPATTSKELLIAEIQKYNTDDNVDGILLQLPLPDNLRNSTQIIIDNISPDKDVDGLTSYNLGQLLVRSSKTIYPCTPKGCMELLKRYSVILKGKKAIVIGRSTLVGMPLAIMLNQADATVTMAHSKTLNLKKEISQADIVIAAIGIPEMIKGSWLKENAIVIDVGINTVYYKDGERTAVNPNSSSHENKIDSNLQQASKRLVGDVEFSSAIHNSKLITPVPGGVGPMTVAMLLSNTVELWQRRLS